jgi:hypothetical protein
VAYEESIRSITLTSDNTLAVRTGVSNAPGSPTDNAGNQYRCVTVKGEHLVGLSSNTTLVVGVLQNKPQVVNEAATVAIRGVSKVRVTGAVSAGAAVYASANGRGTTTAGTGSGATPIGIALASATDADELIPVLLRLGS